MNRPLFIVIEGVDGSGKSTQIDLLAKRLRQNSLKVLETHEPSDGPIGMLIRNIMKGRIQTDESTIAALFLADRLDHIKNPVDGMMKRLNEGYNIICSRYYFSNYAFQSEFVPAEWLVQCNSLCKTYLKPDLIVYLNVDPNTCINRLAKNRIGSEIYENIEKIIKAHQEFLKAFKSFGSDENIHIIDGNLSIKEINDSIWKIIQEIQNKAPALSSIK